jgi:hypothetical protein
VEGRDQQQKQVGCLEAKPKLVPIWFGCDHRPFGSGGDGGENVGADVSFMVVPPLGKRRC